MSWLFSYFSIKTGFFPLDPFIFLIHLGAKRLWLHRICFFHRHYSPLWTLACRTMSFHFFPICHQLSPSSHYQHLKISFYFLFPSFPGSSPSSRPIQFFSDTSFWASYPPAFSLAPNMHAEVFWQESPVSKAAELRRYSILSKKKKKRVWLQYGLKHD